MSVVENPVVPLTEIEFVIPRRAEQLTAAGFETVADVADADIAEIDAAIVAGGSDATRIRNGARALDPEYPASWYVTELTRAGAGRS